MITYGWLKSWFKSRSKFQTFSSKKRSESFKRGSCIQEVSNIVIWRGNLSYFGKLVAEQRRSQRRPPTVRKYYGCGNDLGDKYKTPPCNIIIKHVDKRVTRKDSATGQLIHSQDYSSTYYHPIAAHITKKNPLFSGQVYVRYELYNSLDDDQRNYVNTLNSLNIFFK